MWTTLGIAVVVVLVIVVLSKTSFGVRRLTPDVLQTATLLYESMCKWRAEAHASKSPLLARDNLVYAEAYATTLRSLLDDSQSRQLFKVNMMRMAQEIQKELNAKTRALLTSYPSLHPNKAGTNVRTGMPAQ